MSSNIKISEIERKTSRTINQDGLETISMGLIMIVFSLIPLLGPFTSLSDTWSIILLISVIILAFVTSSKTAKKYITYPRVGFVKFKNHPVKKIIMVIAVLLLMPVGRDIIRSISGMEYFESIKSIYSGCWFAVFAFCYTYYSGFSRKIGLLFSILFLLGGFLVMLFPIASRELAYYCQLALMALIVLFVGIFQLRRFLKKYPKPVQEVTEMSSDIKISDIERKTSRAINQDGLDTTAVGIMLLALPLMRLLDLMAGLSDNWLILSLVSMMILSFLTSSKMIRRRVTFPRIGYVKFKNQLWKIILLIITVLLLMKAGRSFIRNNWGVEYFESIKYIYWNCGLALFAFCYTYSSGFSKKIGLLFSFIYLLGGFIVILIPMANRELAYYSQLTLIAIIVLIVGIFQLRRFLKKYPKPSQEVTDGTIN